MLSNHAIESVILLADKLTAKGTLLQPLPETPLNTLVVNSTPMILESDIDPVTLLNDASRISIDPANPGVSDHDLQMEELGELIATTIQGNHRLAKNVVNPIILQVTDEVTSGVNGLSGGLETRVSIVPHEYQMVWTNPLLLQSVSIFRDVSLDITPCPRCIPVQPESTLIEAMLSAASGYTTEITQWIASLPAGFLSKVFNEVFNDDASTDRGTVQTILRDGGFGFDKDLSLAVYLMAKGLVDLEIPNINLSAVDYRNVLNAVEIQSAIAVLYCIDKRGTDNSGNVLVVKWPWAQNLAFSQILDSYVICVNQDVYTRWLEDGGSADILLGASITDQSNSYQGLIDDGQRYKDAWVRKVAAMRSADGSNKTASVKSFLLRALTKCINAMDSNDQYVGESVRIAIHDRASAYVSAITDNDVSCLSSLCQDAVCEVMFANTNVKFLLTTIDKICSDNPGINIREAALLATVDLVVKWISTNYIIKDA